MKNKPMTNKPMLSIVIPCFNEEDVIVEAMRQFKEFALNCVSMDIEFIFIDDGSDDSTLELLKAYAEEDSRIKVIVFSRNFGHQIAVTAGIDAANGDAVVMIDADLQDPPEVINQMILKWQSGYDVVYGVRTERLGESRFKLASARVFYRILNYLSDVRIPLDTGDFRLISRNVADTLRAMPERDRFVRGMVSWAGFKQTALPYKRIERFAGKSKYSLIKMLSFAMDGILSFSTKPLNMSIKIGFLCASISIISIFYVLYLRLFTNVWVEGWTTLMIVTLLIGGTQLISIGILGEYIGRIHNGAKNRPLYIIQEFIGFTSTAPVISRSPIFLNSAAKKK